MRVRAVVGPHVYRLPPQPYGPYVLVLWIFQSGRMENPPQRLPGAAKHDGPSSVPSLFDAFLRLAVGPACRAQKC